MRAAASDPITVRDARAGGAGRPPPCRRGARAPRSPAAARREGDEALNEQMRLSFKDLDEQDAHLVEVNGKPAPDLEAPAET